MNLLQLKQTVDELVNMFDKVTKFEDVKVKFKTFDSSFEENADEYQRPDNITAVEVDVMNWNAITITIENDDPTLDDLSVKAGHNMGA